MNNRKIGMITSKTNFYYEAFFLVFIQGFFMCSSTLKIIPDKPFIKKFIGESVDLTCITNVDGSAENSTLSSKSVEQQESDVNWILPMNRESKVLVENSGNELSVRISNLTEADNGNYTCTARRPNSSKVYQSVALTLAVLTKSQRTSCGEDSFHCEKDICISSRYKCDGVADCPSGIDELPYYCGNEPCLNKLKCSDGRCLPAQRCCREPSTSPPNCTIHSSILCCKQLIQLSLIDQDVYNLADARTKEANLIKFYVMAGSLLLWMIVVIILLCTQFRVVPRICRPGITMVVLPRAMDETSGCRPSVMPGSVIASDVAGNSPINNQSGSFLRHNGSPANVLQADTISPPPSYLEIKPE